MYMTNEKWEQNNQDYLKESYEETGFTTGGYAIRKLICGGCGRVFYTTIYTKKYCHSYWCCRQKDYRKRVTDAASAQNEHLVKRNASAK